MDQAPNPTSSERTDRQLRQLVELAELTMTVARALAAQALRQAELAPIPGTDPTIPIARIARSVRQTLALEAKLDRDRHAQPHPNSYAADIARRDGNHIRVQRYEVRKQIEHIIDTECEPSDRENLLTDFYERLDDPDFTPTLARYRVQEIVNKLCRTLGLAETDLPEPRRMGEQSETHHPTPQTEPHPTPQTTTTTPDPPD